MATISSKNDKGLPDVGNLQELSKILGVTVDYLLNEDEDLPALSMKKEMEGLVWSGLVQDFVQ